MLPFQVLLFTRSYPPLIMILEMKEIRSYFKIPLKQQQHSLVFLLIFLLGKRISPYGAPDPTSKYCFHLMRPVLLKTKLRLLDWQENVNQKIIFYHHIEDWEKMMLLLSRRCAFSSKVKTSSSNKTTVGTSSKKQQVHEA